MNKLSGIFLLLIFTYLCPDSQAQTTRFPHGVTNADPVGAMRNLPIPDPTKIHSLWNDFDIRGVTSTWEDLKDTGSTVTLSQADPGVYVLATDTDKGDQTLIRTDEIFKFEAGKELWFAARYKVSDASDALVLCGLTARTTNDVDDSVVDGVYMRINTLEYVDFHVTKDGVSSSSHGTDTGLAVIDDTFFEFAFYYNGYNGVEFFINDSPYATIPVANLPDDEDLAVIIGIQNAAAAANSLTLDYIFVAKER